MAQLVVMYKTPTDPAAFDDHYFKTHIPMAKKLPGLRKYEVNQGAIATPAGPAGVHLIAVLHFDDLAAIGAAFASPEGKAAAGDVPKFATCGAEMLMFDTKTV